MEENKCIHCDKYGDCFLKSNYDIAIPCEICEEYEEADDERRKIAGV